jgi:hypothetical protein
MATESTKAIRLLGLPQETTEDDLGRMIAELIKPDQQPVGDESQYRVQTPFLMFVV